MSVLVAVLPLAVLVVSMTVTSRRLRLPLPAEVALPIAALLAYLVQLPRALAAESEPGALMQVHARCVEGLLTSLTPLAIVAGAILLFTGLERSGAMARLTEWLRRLSPDRVVQAMLVGWSFSYLVEGLSGFGTPAALAAPVLVALGFPAIRAAAACLVMNTVPVVFGAVGTPIWFGLGEIGLTPAEQLAVGGRAALVQAIASPIVVISALLILMPWRDVRGRLVSVLLILAATAAGSLVAARFSTEFPSIVGGLCGLAASAIVARVIGARHNAHPQAEPTTAHDTPGLPLWRALTPLLLTIVLLAITRLEPVGIKPLLLADAPAVVLDLGFLGVLSISASLVVGLEKIFGTGIGWSMAVLYVPFIIPFVLAFAVSVPLLRMSRATAAGAMRGTASRLVKPAIALAGALVLVKLMTHGGEDAPARLIGDAMARAVGAVEPGLWPSVAPLLGALGSFFSGSATVSNLTFGPVQEAIAMTLGLDRLDVLAMQSIGAAMGNMVCIHNIVAVAAVLGLLAGKRRAQAESEAASASRDVRPVSAALRLTIGPMLLYALVSGVAAAILL
jgi:lactate permease